MTRGVPKTLSTKRHCTVDITRPETAEKIIQFVQETGLTANRIMNMPLDYAVNHAKTGTIQVYQTALVFDNEEDSEEPNPTDCPA